MTRAHLSPIRPMRRAQMTCPECGGWRGGHMTGCPEMPEPEELDDGDTLAVADSADPEGEGTPRAEIGAGSLSQGGRTPRGQKATDAPGVAK